MHYFINYTPNINEGIQSEEVSEHEFIELCLELEQDNIEPDIEHVSNDELHLVNAGQYFYS